jgi:predicted dehydrogenase
MHGYAETEVFAPNVVQARKMIEEGAIGDVISVRAREAHSGPHAPHFWDAETAGGGALLDMGCHTIEAARYFFGKDVPMTEAFAWGATLSHADKTTGEDNAVALIKFANGGISITESSWSMKGGMELRNEITGTGGRLITDSTATPVHGFITNPAGLPDGEGGRRHGLGLSDPGRGARLRLHGGDASLRRVLPRRGTSRARRSRRLRRQLRARRLLPLDAERPLGADRDRRESPGRAPRAVAG